MPIGAEIKKLLPRRLLWRLIIIVMAPLVLLQIVTTIVFYNQHWETVTRRLAYSVAGDIAVMIAMRADHPDEDGEIALQDLALNALALKIDFVDGAILPNAPVVTGDNMVERWLVTALRDRVGKPFQIDARSFERDVEINVQLPKGVLKVLAPRKRLSSATTYIFLLWMVGTSAILLVVAMVFMRNQVRPIRLLAAAADRFGKGRDVPNFRPAGASEVRQAAAAFIEMRDRIRRQIAQRTDMLSGVSHDLRTPLTRMKLQLAMLPDSSETADLKADVADMERMIDGYLSFVRGEGHEAPSDTDLGDLLREIVEGVRRDGAAIELTTDGDIRVAARRNALKRCITNLVTNAARHGRHITVAAARRDDSIEITVDDDGPGIAASQREEVFRPFVRLESSRNPETGGVGLGLTIARDIIRGHGGDIVLGDAPGGGLRASLRLPV
jgi:two-component system osmolarity sensor histidine kinase EnvZ